MRISDWSSDECSSDLQGARCGCHATGQATVKGYNVRTNLCRVGASHRRSPCQSSCQSSWRMPMNSVIKPAAFQKPGAAKEEVFISNRLAAFARSEERRVGKEGVSKGDTRWSQ